ncbi:hypothetical protein GPL17_27335 [Bradyrhizobium yuanmingense]|nr:hypothetical protein [Bradyrhizobium yuanmingense]MVT54179.1 hypothetical protein [Bradyrhizobium yuanmingense]
MQFLALFSGDHDAALDEVPARSNIDRRLSHPPAAFPLERPLPNAHHKHLRAQTGEKLQLMKLRTRMPFRKFMALSYLQMKSISGYALS